MGEALFHVKQKCLHGRANGQSWALLVVIGPGGRSEMSLLIGHVSPARAVFAHHDVASCFARCHANHSGVSSSGSTSARGDGCASGFFVDAFLPRFVSTL